MSLCSVSITSLALITIIFSANCGDALGLRNKTGKNYARDPDIYRNVTQIIKSRGYAVEEHLVTTKDGFILNIQRIPRGKYKYASMKSKPVVFLQHGLLLDSTNWVLNSPKSSLAYILADNGYDVWLGNIRGNAYSKRHEYLKTSQSEFWDWSWEEMAKYDLPAMIDHVLDTTGQSQLFYIGHSQGSLIGFTGFSENRNLSSKIRKFFALAPVYTINQCTNILRTSAYALYPVARFFQNYADREFDPKYVLEMLISIGFCGGRWSKKACYRLGETVFGVNSNNINLARVPAILAHFGSATSVKNIVHFAQLIYDKDCQKFDYGFFENYQRYGQFRPPKYRVEDMQTPTVLFSGSNDKLADPRDVADLRPRITNLEYSEEIAGWNHVDFLYGIDAPKRLYSKLLEMLASSIET